MDLLLSLCIYIKGLQSCKQQLYRFVIKEHPLIFMRPVIRSLQILKS